MDPAYPRFKPQMHVMECAACHMKVMAKGDWQGWKSVALPDGRQVNYCNKSPCQQQYDVLLVQVQSGNIPVALRAGQPGQLIEPAGVPQFDEVQALRARVRELELENVELKGGQSTAPQEEVEKPGELPPHVAAQQPSAKKRVHVEDPETDGKAMCGALGEELKVPEEMSFSDVPCDDCVDAWAARQEGRKPQQTAEDALSAPESPALPQTVQKIEPPRMEPVALPEPVPAIPDIQDYSSLPKLDQDLISRVNDGAIIGGPILLTQATYPDIDFTKVKPGQLRDGIGAFFTKHEVEAIDRAAPAGGEVIGMVFTLRARAVDKRSLDGQEGSG